MVRTAVRTAKPAPHVIASRRHAERRARAGRADRRLPCAVAGASSAPQRHVVLVPGNPGQPGFYARAAAGLSVALRLGLRRRPRRPPRAPHAGLAATARFTLPEQVAHVSAF